MKIVSDHGWPKASLSAADDENAFKAFKNERDYISQTGHHKTTVAAMDWATREIDRLRSQAFDAWAVEMDGAFFSLWLTEAAANKVMDGYRRGSDADWRVAPIKIIRK